MIFKSKDTLRNSLMTTRPERDLQQMIHASIAFLVNMAEVTLLKQAD
jgi:hypothetical protein